MVLRFTNMVSAYLAHMPTNQLQSLLSKFNFTHVPKSFITFPRIFPKVLLFHSQFPQEIVTSRPPRLAVSAASDANVSTDPTERTEKMKELLRKALGQGESEMVNVFVKKLIVISW